MDEKDFESEAKRLGLICSLLSDIDLEFLTSTVSVADAIGPILDPTTYRDMLYRTGNMHDIARLATLAKPLVEEFNNLKEKIIANAS